jgi:hypothetical protein
MASIQLLINGQDNESAYQRMLNTIRSSESFAFAGAGVSRPLGYPTWPTLLGELAAETRKVCGEQIVDGDGKKLTVAEVEAIDDLLLQAEIFKNNLKDRYGSVMQQTFARKDVVTSDIREIARLPFQHILTSNYDIALEVAHGELQLQCESICLCDSAALEFVNKLFDRKYKRRIVHVHGRFDRVESIVLTESDYAALYTGSKVVERFWENVPMYRSCVFLGFSFSDKEITEQFNLRNFNRAHRKESQTPHFALLELASGDTEKERRLRSTFKAKFGVDAVFFDPIDQSYSGYSKAIGAIVKDISPSLELHRIASADSLGIADDVAKLEALTILNMKKNATGELR